MESIQDRIIEIGIYIMAGVALLAIHYRFADTVFSPESLSNQKGGQALELFFFKYFSLLFGSICLLIALNRLAVLIKNRK